MPLFVEFLLLGLFGFALLGIFKYLVSRIPENRYYKYGLAVAATTGFLLFWVNGAVGIIGSENNDANMMYVMILPIAFIAAVAVRFKPAGLFWVMNAGAVAFVVIAIVALMFNVGVSGPVWPWDVVWITAFFVGLSLFSGWLFRMANRMERQHIEAE